MAKIGLNIFVQGFSGKLIIRWLEASAPLAEVGRSPAFDFTYDDIYTINGLNPVVHIVQLWQSVDGVALTTLIKGWEIEPGTTGEAAIDRFQYVVGRGFNNVNQATGTEVWADPADTDTELVDERLDGATQDELIVHEAGYGDHINAEYELRVGGGIILLDGKTFDDGSRWFISRVKVISNGFIGGSSGGGGFSNGVVPVTGDVNLNTLYNSLVTVNGSTPVVEIVFPALGSIPNGTRVVFNTHRGAQNYLSLLLNGTETFWIDGSARNKFYMAKGETLELYFDSGICNVVHYVGNDKIRGSILTDYQSRVTNGPYLLADSSTGLLQGTDYPGIYEWLLAQPPGVAVNDAVWATGDNNRFWNLNAIAGTFRVPHLANVHLRFRLSTEAPGTYESDAMPDHDHLLFGSGNNVTLSNTNYATVFHTVGGNNSYAIFGSTTAPIVGRSSKAYINGTIQSPGLTQSITENRVKSIRQIPLIVL